MNNEVKSLNISIRFKISGKGYDEKIYTAAHKATPDKLINIQHISRDDDGSISTVNDAIIKKRLGYSIFISKTDAHKAIKRSSFIVR